MCHACVCMSGQTICLREDQRWGTEWTESGAAMRRIYGERQNTHQEGRKGREGRVRGRFLVFFSQQEEEEGRKPGNGGDN